VHADYDTFISNQSSNIGGAIWGEGGTIETTGSDFANNTAAGLGGAIECDNNELDVVGTTFSGNASNSGNTDSANYGGAIYSTCFLYVDNSTFYGNTAQNSEGGAIYQAGTQYAGVFFSTLVSNAASEGAAVSSQNGANMGLQASIFSHNTHGHTCAGAFASFGYNLADDGDCGGALSDPTDQPNVTLTMGSLTGNGGPTPTIMPATGNPAINNVPPANVICTSETTDQRGYARPVGPGCDSGSVEVGATGDIIFQNGFELD
jgi:predicted outer membrane repeat protein